MQILYAMYACVCVSLSLSSKDNLAYCWAPAPYVFNRSIEVSQYAVVFPLTVFEMPVFRYFLAWSTSRLVVSGERAEDVVVCRTMLNKQMTTLRTTFLKRVQNVTVLSLKWIRSFFLRERRRYLVLLKASSHRSLRSYEAWCFHYAAVILFVVFWMFAPGMYAVSSTCPPILWLIVDMVALFWGFVFTMQHFFWAVCGIWYLFVEICVYRTEWGLRVEG